MCVIKVASIAPPALSVLEIERAGIAAFAASFQRTRMPTNRPEALSICAAVRFDAPCCARSTPCWRSSTGCGRRESGRTACAICGPTHSASCCWFPLYRELGERRWLEQAEQLVADVERVLGRARGLRIGEAPH